MARYIDADRTKTELLENAVRIYDTQNMSTEDVVCIIDEQPTADVAEVKCGEWVLRRQSNGVRIHQCSVCGRPIYTIDEDLKDYAPYCHCGAKMDGERKECEDEL